MNRKEAGIRPGTRRGFLQPTEMGYSLVEILAALAVLSVIIVALTALFTHSLAGIFSAGRTTGALYTAQGEVEYRIAEDATGTGQNLQMDFPEGGRVTVWGRKVSVPPLTTFVSEPQARVRFVAVGANLTVLTSPDGVKWTRRTVPGAGVISERLNGVAWGGPLLNRQFVAVGDNGTILTSADGITWSRRVSGVIAHLNGVAWGGPLLNRQFVAVGDNGTILTSADGITWSRRDSGGVTQRLNGVVWGETGETTGETTGWFVAVGDRAAVYSADGLTWQAPPTAPTFLARSAAFAENKFVAAGEQRVGENGLFDGGIYTLPDGTDWRMPAVKEEAQYRFRGLTWGDGKFIAVGTVVGTDGAENSIICRVSYPDPENPFNPVLEASPAPSGDRLYQVVWGYNQFIAVGKLGAILSSNDGLNWQRRTSGTTDDLFGVASGDMGL